MFDYEILNPGKLIFLNYDLAMHVAESFSEERMDVIEAVIRKARIAELVSFGSNGLQATPLPLLYEPGGRYGRLVGHMARANPDWQDFDGEVEVMVLFRPADAYVSPSFYPSKAEGGRVVPTWNYLVVQAWGPLVVRDDVEWVEGLVRRLTDHHEAALSDPWSIDDAPADYIQKQLRAIVGIEIEISRLQAKWKLSQNRPQADIDGVIGALSLGSMNDRVISDAMDGRLP